MQQEIHLAFLTSEHPRAVVSLLALCVMSMALWGSVVATNPNLADAMQAGSRVVGQASQTIISYAGLDGLSVTLAEAGSGIEAAKYDYLAMHQRASTQSVTGREYSSVFDSDVNQTRGAASHKGSIAGASISLEIGATPWSGLYQLAQGR